MEKEYIDRLLKETLRFSDFGPSSENWAGFFEIRDKFTRKNIDNVIALLFNNIREGLDSYIVAVSYFVNRDETLPDHYKLYKDVIRAEDELINRGLIKEIKGNSYYSDDDAVFEKQYFELNTDFSYCLPDKKLLKQLSLIKLCDSNVGMNAGYCFFISLKHNVIIYPHGDNSGYGFYVIKKNQPSLAFKILDSVAQVDFLNTRIVAGLM